MRDRKITKVVDALKAQDRIILWVECKHTISITRIAWEAANSRDLPTVGEVVQCPHCPDPPPPTAAELRAQKPAHQLWHEAGEP